MSGAITKRRLRGALLMLCAYLVEQCLIVVAHEHAHSTAAWLLGYTSTPFTVVWGNPITMQGFDEGVPYDDLFHERGHFGEAVIGGIPLLMHIVFATASLSLLLSRCRRIRPWLFFAAYWFAVVNLAELVAYIWMRPFIPTGDTGRFNAGMDLSPWPLFIGGTIFLVVSLWLLARRIGPRLVALTDGTRFTHRAIVSAASFVIFLWGSGIRMMSLYPDPQWKVGLIGVAGFFVWLALDRRRSA